MLNHIRSIVVLALATGLMWNCGGERVTAVRDRDRRAGWPSPEQIGPRTEMSYRLR